MHEVRRVCSRRVVPRRDRPIERRVVRRHDEPDHVRRDPEALDARVGRLGVTDHGDHGRRRSSGGRARFRAAPQKRRRSSGAPARELLEVDLDALDPPALCEHTGLRLDAGRDEHPSSRREVGVEVEALLVAQQLLHARDLSHSLHLDHDRGALTVAAQEVDGADVGRVLTPDEQQVVTQRRHPFRDQLLELRLDSVLVAGRGRRRGRRSSRARSRGARWSSFSPPGFVATSKLSCSRTVHGGVIQLSGLYALASACTAMEPSAFSMMRRSAGGRRAPRRPSYSTEQLATSMRTAALYHRCTARGALATSTMPRSERARGVVACWCWVPTETISTRWCSSHTSCVRSSGSVPST